MLQNILALPLLLFAFMVQAQVVTLSPERPALGEMVTLTFQTQQGNGGLAGYTGDIYAHTGVITNQSTSPSDWKQVVAEWNENKPQLKLNPLGNGKHQLSFRIDELYKVPQSASIYALCFVFRSADGNLVGKAEGGSDIFVPLRKDFQERFVQPEIMERGQARHPEWAKAATIYEVNVRQYTPEGTFKAFAKHLPRLKEMGVDILWFMPIQPIGEKKRKGSLGSYYSIRDYRGINPEYGTKEDFVQLVEQCHLMGFKVILDWVANHTAWDHHWTESHPEWYTQDKNGNIVSPFDWSDVADLNYDQYYLRRAMAYDMRYWVEEIGLDGFRCDVAGEVPTDFWEDTRRILDDTGRDIWMLAEDEGKPWLLNRAFNANYGWHLHHLMNEIAKGHQKPNVVFDYFKKAKETYPKGTYPMQFLTNHDENSWQGTIGERLGKAHQAFAVFAYTVPGIPLIYSGQEAGLNHRLAFFEKDEIKWDDLSLVPFYTQLNQLKAANPALWNGEAGSWITHIEHDRPDKVVAFSRTKGDHEIVSVINLSGEATDVNLRPDKQLGIYKDYFTQQSIVLEERSILKLPPWGYHVLVLQKREPKRKFQSAKETGTGLIIEVSDGQYAITPRGTGAVEVEFRPAGQPASNLPSFAFPEEYDRPKATWESQGGRGEYILPDLTVKIQEQPFELSFHHKGKKLLVEEEGYFKNEEWQGFRFRVNEDEALMGGGERVLGMDRRGHRLELNNKPSYGYETHAALMYYSMPMMVSSQKYALFFDNSAKGYLDLAASEKDIVQLDAAGGRMAYAVVAGSDWPGLMQNFTEATGRQPLPPRWALGNFASRMGYHNQAEVEDVAARYQKDDIPLDAIVLDLFWFGPDIKGHLGHLDWDRKAFPEPERMMAGLKKQGVKTILITEPFILKDTKTYPEVIEKKLVGTTPQGEPYHYDFYFGNTTLIDLFKPEAKEWFWNIYKKHTRSGVAGWWGDLGEPEVHPDDMQHHLASAKILHNAYGSEWAKMVYQGYQKDFPDTRPLILMRAGFVGSQRYGLIPWTGDVNRSWGGLKPQVELGLSMGLQGLGYMHSDLGGFAGDYEDAELYTRWLQYGVFQPVYRTHAQESVPAEPVFWDEATKDIARRYIKLRYQLTPYTYTLAHQNATKGLPLMRPLFFYDDNPHLLRKTDSYLWGQDLLVSPVVEQGAEEQVVYFPEGGPWFNLWTDHEHTGGQADTVSLSLADIPVYVRAGGFLPMANVVQSLDDYSTDTLTVHYYHHTSVKESTRVFYEDDGKTPDAFAKGEYEYLAFEAEREGNWLEIEVNREGSDYEGRPARRFIQVVVHNWDKPPRRIKTGKLKMSPIQAYDSAARTLTIPLWIDNKEVELRIKS